MQPKRLGEVKVQGMDGDESASIFGRSLHVQVHRGQSFVTPVMPVTRKHLSDKALTPQVRGELKSPIAVIQEYVEKETMEEYRRCNGTLNKIYEDVATYSMSSSDMYNVATLQIEPMGIKDPESLSTIMKQLDIPSLSAVCMPPMKGDLEQYERALRSWIDKADQCGKDCVPQVRMDEEPETFAERIMLLKEYAKTGSVRMIDFRYAPREKNQIQYSTLWSIADDFPAIFHCSNVQGKVIINNYLESRRNFDLSMTGFDSMSARRLKPRYYPQRAVESLDEIQDYRWSDQFIEAGIEGRHWEALESPHFECDCPICRRRTQSEILETYAYNVEGTIYDPGFMKRISRLHDLYSSEMSLIEMRKAIVSDEIEDYFNEIEERRLTFQRDSLFGEIRPSQRKSGRRLEILE